ncbi:MAG: alkaline phosphatase family protein [Desulfovermiculus sp.]|nr:alkaline phosphatase family protein [Desulfovermiculus sp.]
MAHPQRPRCVVLGLDGLPFSVAQGLGSSGKFPNLARLSRTPQARPIQAELPELSPVNWTSFYTASGPETHGVFGFTHIDPATYQLAIADFTQVQAPTIFDRLGQKGLMSKVINLPNTYPARALKGMLIAGFVAPDLEQAVYPRVLAGMLSSRGYKLEADTERGRSDYELLLTELGATLDSRRMALDLLWPDLAWDLFVFVLTETDRLGHFLFPAIVHATDPWHSPVMRLLVKWDALIGEFLDRYASLPEPKRLLVLADHGFTHLETEVDVNVWLRRMGYLQLARRPAHELDASCIADESTALALDPGRVYIHARERFARGHVPGAQVKTLQEEIRTGLLELTWQGRPVMAQVRRGEELYPGSRLAMVPDLICTPNPGFDLKAKFDRTDIFGFFGRRGMHTADDVFYYDSKGVRIDRVRDVGREVLEFFEGSQKIMV